MFLKIESVLYFVSDIHRAAQWYATLFNTDVQYENPQFAFIQTPDLVLGFHPADAKNPSGHSSSVAYWAVDDVELTLNSLLANGCTLYRGPAKTSLDATVAMLIDPFGNRLGITQHTSRAC